MLQPPKENILVIKLSALGDFIQALGPMQAIRKHHPAAQITLLTTDAFQKLSKECGYFDQVWIDERPTWLMPFKWLSFKQKIDAAKFTRIYDLQNNDRSNLYFKILRKPKPEWIGTAQGASHQSQLSNRSKEHAFDRHKQALFLAGIKSIKIDSLKWMQADISKFNLPSKYAILVPGCAPQHPHKRWPAEKYGKLANYLTKQGIFPILIGTKDDETATKHITKICPTAINLTNQTSLKHIAELAKSATIAIGNDTGPMHIIAATGCKTISLFSEQTNPVKHAPNGKDVTTLQENNLKNLTLEKVTSLLALQ